MITLGTLPTKNEFLAASNSFGGDPATANEINREIRSMLTGAHGENCGCSMHGSKNEKWIATGIMYGLQIAATREVGKVPTTD
jgi:hypothetical protein